LIEKNIIYPFILNVKRKTLRDDEKCVNYYEIIGSAMVARKRKKDISNAINHLIKHANRGEWIHRQQQFNLDMFTEAAEHVGVETDKFIQALEDSDYNSVVQGYLFELFATCYWDNEDKNLIENYLQCKGWKETAYGKRYLNALNESNVQLWEVVSVNVGQSVDIRPAGTSNTPMQVSEAEGSRQLQEWCFIAARPIILDKHYEFSSVILPFTLDQALATQLMLDNIYQDTINTLQGLPFNGGIQTAATEKTNEKLSNYLFIYWTKHIYLSLTAMEESTLS
jgi:hypothetical protein